MSKSTTAAMGNFRAKIGGKLQGNQERMAATDAYCAPHPGGMEWKEKEAKGHTSKQHTARHSDY